MKTIKMMAVIVLGFCTAMSVFRSHEAAADPYLGTINVFDGGTVNNVTTTVRDAGRQPDAGIISDGGATDTIYQSNAFYVAPKQWYTVQCRQDCYVNGDTPTCDAGVCPRLYAEQWLSEPTSLTYASYSYTIFSGIVENDGGFRTDAGSYTGGLIAISPTDGGATCNCQVFAQPYLVPR